MKFFAEFHSIFEVKLRVRDHRGHDCVGSAVMNQIDQAVDAGESFRAGFFDLFHRFFLCG